MASPHLRQLRETSAVRAVSDGALDDAVAAPTWILVGPKLRAVVRARGEWRYTDRFARYHPYGRRLAAGAASRLDRGRDRPFARFHMDQNTIVIGLDAVIGVLRYVFLGAAGLTGIVCAG